MIKVTLLSETTEIDNRDTGTTELHPANGPTVEIPSGMVFDVLESIFENAADCPPDALRLIDTLRKMHDALY